MIGLRNAIQRPEAMSPESHVRKRTGRTRWLEELDSRLP
jgi:hypothetical protein